MKKSIKTVLLSLVMVGTLAGCDFGNPTQSNKPSSSENSTSFTSNSSSEESSTSSSTTTSTSSVVVKTDIVLTAEKTRVEVNEQLTITSNVEGVTYTTTEGASIVNGVFTATKEGTYVVTAHKEGDYVDGTITITVYKKVEIVLTADNTNPDVNEGVTITSNVEGVTYTTTEGASINGGVFSAIKEGTYVVTGHKDGDFVDGTVTINVTFKKTAAKVKALLKSMKEGQNFTVTANNLLGTNKMYRTENYFFDAQSNEGQALFTNIIPGTSFEKVTHYIKVVNNELIIGNDVVYQDSEGKGVIATDLYDTDGLYYVNVDALELTEDNGVFYTADKNTITAMACIVGSEYVLYADMIEFSFNNYFDLAARIIYVDPSTNQIDEESTNAFGYITFSDIGKTVAPVVDEAVKNVTVSETGMSEEVASSFMLTKGHLKTTIKEIIGEQVNTLGTSEYHFDEKYLIEDKVVRGTTYHNFYEKDDQGYANYVGIGPDNQVVKTNYGEWGSFTFPFATLKLSDFRLTSAHTYSYMGYSSDAIAKYLAWASIGENAISYITAKEENGKIVSFVCETENQLVNTGTDDAPIYTYAKYVFEIEVLPYETIVAPAPFEVDADTVKIKAYFDDLNEAGANYTLMIGDHYSPSDLITIKVTEKTILIKEYKDKVTTYRGYHMLDDGVIEFTAENAGQATTDTTDDDVATARLVKDVEMTEGQTLASLLGFNIAPETMQFDEDGNIVFKQGVLNGGSGLFDAFYWKDYAMNGTVKLNVYNNTISSINFQYGEGQTLAQYANLFMFGTTGLTSVFEKDLVGKLATLKEAPKPTTWAEESPAIYAKMVTLLGEELAAIIPYVYDQEYSGLFDEGTLSSGTNLKIKLTDGSKSFSNDYRKAITQACVNAGFTKVTDWSAKLTLETKYITVGSLGTSINIVYKDL